MTYSMTYLEEQKRQCFLSQGPSLFIPYPGDYTGWKSGTEMDETFTLSTQPRTLYESEIKLAQMYLASSKYSSQKLVFSGCTLINPDDQLLQLSHSQLDEIEKSQLLQSSRKGPTGGTRSIYERVLLIREAGYQGNGNRSLPVGSN